MSDALPIDQRLKSTAKQLLNVHWPSGQPNVFLFATPRGGSTWVMEIIGSQPGFKRCSEPLNLRHPIVRKHLGLSSWRELYNDSALPAIERYFKGFVQGKLHFRDPSPLKRYYRLITRRIVLKIIHGGEQWINRFRDSCNGRIVYLLRHPIAVSLSRTQYPRIEAFLNSDYTKNFSKEQLGGSRRILQSGSDLDRGVLSWCLQNAVSLRNIQPDWAVVSYEQLVVDPKPVVDCLAEKLELPRKDPMLGALETPSAVLYKSDRETQQMLQKKADRSALVEKWRKHITKHDEQRAMDILKIFDINAYHAGEVMPSQDLWISR